MSDQDVLQKTLVFHRRKSYGFGVNWIKKKKKIVCTGATNEPSCPTCMSVSPLVLMLLIVAMQRRRKVPLFLEDERDVRENIVQYDDEGGGEEDTEAFDMAALRNLKVICDSKVQNVTPETPSANPYSASARTSYKTLPDNIVFQEFIWDRLKVTDADPSAPPYDSLQTYAFEGNGSVAGSLSSLESPNSDSEQSYDYLSNCGPRFKKLADLYGNLEGSSVFS